MSTSHTYRKRIKVITEQIKTLRGVSHIPSPLKRPGDPANWLPSKGDAKATETRREAFNKADARRVDKANIAYWLETFGPDKRN